MFPTFPDEVMAAVAGAAFLLQLPSAKDKMKALDASVVVAMVSMGAIAYLFWPDPVVLVQITSFYSPHAYNLVIWPLAAWACFSKRFKPWQFLPMLALVYGLDEAVWNALAWAYFRSDAAAIGYLSLPDWQLFFAVCVCASAVCWLAVRPSIRLNATAPVLAAFGFVWAWVARFPTLAATGIATAPASVVALALAWELMWQLAFWAFAASTFYPPRLSGAPKERAVA